MKTSEFDKTFDDGESVLRMLDKENTHRPGLEQRRLNIGEREWVNVDVGVKIIKIR